MKPIWTLFVVTICAISCNNTGGRSSSKNSEAGDAEVRIIRQMGQLPSDTIKYLPLIGNLAEVKSSKTKQNYQLVIGKNLENGDNLTVNELSTLVFRHGSELHKLTLSVPVQPKYQSIEVESFEEFATQYGSIKWSLESWYNHFAGLGKSEFVRWEAITYEQ